MDEIGQKTNLFWDAASNSTRTIRVQRVLTWFTPVFQLSEHRSLYKDSHLSLAYGMCWKSYGLHPRRWHSDPQGLKLFPETTEAAEIRLAAAQFQLPGSTASNCLQQRFFFLRCFLRETHYPAGTTMIHFTVSSLLAHHSSSCLTQHAVTTCKDFTLIAKIITFSVMPSIHLLLSPQSALNTIFSKGKKLF